MSMPKYQLTDALYWPMLSQTQSSISWKIPLEMRVLPTPDFLKCGSEAGSEVGSDAGSYAGFEVSFQSDSQSCFQAGSLPGLQAGCEAATPDTLNYFVSTSEYSRQSRLAEICQLPAIYSPIV